MQTTKYALREMIDETQMELIDRLKLSCPNLSEDALQLLASGMIGRVIERKTSTMDQKNERLHEILKGELK